MQDDPIPIDSWLIALAVFGLSLWLLAPIVSAFATSFLDVRHAALLSHVAALAATALWLSIDFKDHKTSWGAVIGISKPIPVPWAWAFCGASAASIAVATIWAHVKLLSISQPLLAAALLKAVTVKLDTSNSAMLVQLVVALLAGPVLEEVIFRGLLLNRLRASLGMWPSIFASAFVFGAFHVYAFVWAFCLGVLLAWVAMRSGGLLGPILCHIGYNTSMLLMSTTGLAFGSPNQSLRTYTDEWGLTVSLLLIFGFATLLGALKYLKLKCRP